MALYMTQFTYTDTATAAMAKNPQDRSVGLEKTIKKLGGDLKCIYFCFGDFDGVAIVEVPDHVTTLALLMAVMAAGHLKAVKTTQLLTMKESIKAMKLANDIVNKGPE